jgi:uncharacterized damage-inducible protein DinB
MNYVEEAVAMWELVRKGTISEVENVPEENWDFRPGDGARTLRQLVRHVLESAEFFVHELLIDDGTFMRSFDEKYRTEATSGLPPSSTKTEALELLRARSAEDARRLREAGQSLATKTMKTSKGEDSRLKGVWFAVSHEMYHRGQLTIYERAMGEVPAMTKQIEARRNAK